jgi:hypothetical protein
LAFKNGKKLYSDISRFILSLVWANEDNFARATVPRPVTLVSDVILQLKIDEG